MLYAANTVFRYANINFAYLLKQIPCGKRNYLIAAELTSGVREWVSAIHAAIRRARGLTSAVSDRINGRLSCKGKTMKC